MSLFQLNKKESVSVRTTLKMGKTNVQAREGARNAAALREPVRLDEALKTKFIFEDAVHELAVPTCVPVFQTFSTPIYQRDLNDSTYELLTML